MLWRDERHAGERKLAVCQRQLQRHHPMALPICVRGQIAIQLCERRFGVHHRLGGERLKRDCGSAQTKNWLGCG